MSSQEPSDEYSELDTGFIHFGLGGPTEVIRELWNEGYLLCHYENTASFSADDYEESASDLEALVEFVENGGICLSRLKRSYGSAGNRKLGVVEPGSDPIIIGVRKDGSLTREFISEKEAQFELEGNPEITHIYKGGKMRESDLRTLEADEYHLVPFEPPFVTFQHWNAVDRQLNALIRGEDLPPESPTSYSSFQIELLCEEYLRQTYSEYFPLIPVGGGSGTNAFDIIGGVGHARIYGEVKNKSSKPDDAISALKEKLAPGSILYCFTRTMPSEDVPEIEVVDLVEMLEELYSNRECRFMMDQMVSRQS